MTSRPAGPKLLKKALDKEEIARVLSQWTGIPLTSMLEDDRQKLLEPRRRAAPPRDRPGAGRQGGRRRGAT